MIKTVSILGSTGSIGRQSLDVISRLEGIRVAARTAGSIVGKNGGAVPPISSEACGDGHPGGGGGALPGAE